MKSRHRYEKLAHLRRLQERIAESEVTVARHRLLLVETHIEQLDTSIIDAEGRHREYLLNGDVSSAQFEAMLLTGLKSSLAQCQSISKLRADNCAECETTYSFAILEKRTAACMAETTHKKWIKEEERRVQAQIDDAYLARRRQRDRCQRD